MRPANLLSQFAFLALGGAIAATPLAAQSSATFPFQLLIQQNSNTTVVPNAANINVAADNLNSPVKLSLIVNYIGQTTATFAGLAQLFGSTAFSVTNPPSLGGSMPVVLNPGDQLTFPFTFTATTANAVSAQFTLAYSEAAPASSTTGNATQGFISLSLIGTAPSFSLSYYLQPQDNVAPIADGGTIQFPSTPAGTTSIAVLVITNTGSGPGTITSVAFGGSSAFQPQGLPLLPGTLNANTSVNIGILYQPALAETDQGTIKVAFGSQIITINLVGTGTAAQFQYEFQQGSQTADVAAGATYTLPDTKVGSVASVTVSVTNTGTATATVPSIGVTGAGFGLTDAPPTPATLLPKGFFSVTFVFAPTQAGSFTGRLRIGSDSFVLMGTGIGPQLQYSYTAGSSAPTVNAGGTVVFAPAQIGSSSTTTFTVTNTGTAPATIGNIFIAQANSPFATSSLPSFPVSLNPNQSTSFNLTFTPTTTGASTATLLVDSQQFQLTGSGNAPPDLPAYSFSGASGVQAPLAQPSVGLTLAAAYPLALTGTLTMSVVPNGFSADPSIQFATGGRTASFTIPANSKQAVFANGTTSIKLQTGSTAGTITLTPSFATSSGYPLTPASAVSQTLTVSPAAPVLLTAQVTALNSTSFTVAISGITNTQVLNQLGFTFTPAANYSLSSTTAQLTVTSPAAAWFGSSAAQNFGGQFVATVAFNLASNVTSVTSPTTAIQALSITATNDQGTSAPISVTLH